MKCYNLLLFFAILAGTCQLGRPTCVLESDFGFVINCAFKKSALFRARNLGGVKAHIGLGFSVGDELGFKESLTNVESNKRRSTSASKFQAQLIQAQQNAKKETQIVPAVPSKSASFTARMGSAEIVPPMAIGHMQKPLTKSIVPPFKPIPPAQERYSVSKSQLPSLSAEPTGEEIMAVLALPKKLPVQDKNAYNNEIIPLAKQMAALHSMNITEEDLEAIIQRQQAQMLKKQTSTTSTTTTTTTTPKSSNKYANSVGKVMNAPKEYYPVGYDKNFDDNFSSRVELPETSFYCGDQKHFPGLYADEDLGCMVFHVCALTDDGLIMKSFLCPESTLFDQTILKCNWWFYVDCKNSKKLYDSNIPISKSYQLMKALTFFSASKNENKNSSKTNDKD